MTQFRAQHPSNSSVRADYGLDHAVGFFVTVREGTRRHEYDALRPGYAQLQGALDFFVTHGFFTSEDLEAAIRARGDGPIDDRAETAGAHLAYDIIDNLRREEVRAEEPPSASSTSRAPFVATAQLRRNMRQFGPSAIFGSREHRERWTDAEWSAHFDKAWADIVVPELSSAPVCTADSAHELLTDNFRKFLAREQQHRIFERASVRCVAQLVEKTGEVNQIWPIQGHVDPDPRILRIRFATQELRDQFRALATKLGWHDEDLGKRLVMEFMENTKRVLK